MHKSLLEILVDPVSKSPLQLQARQCNATGEVIEGALFSADGRSYPITNGIPRFTLTEDPAQRQTERSFGYKWQRADIHDPPEVELSAQNWLVERYGFENVQQMREYFSRRARILDAGCGGEIMVYIYRKKGPIREFADDYIRGLVSPLPPEQAWEMLAPVTKLAQRLAELKAEVEVPEDIPFLGIRAGRYDVQRLIYWHFAKLYWDPNRSFERNNEVNFDWYHPRYAHRHTEEELRKWCADSGLSIIHFNAQESGFTVRAVRN